ncbi:hypothetical protein V499_04513 [Pseudogymnoascus sp. VKM F-103]|uniref:BTB domain-containing protein n=1 Tax=Pseudogymnoascus verrucosus TaxID=342668 RepID=A0A1B8GI38_9PEZI|nr:uncharacterized protein VE01_05162 [Pseudogymnoascus verrucosus]KFY75514.1 hypothetical protein V499_04513 [Pseudogymnoascus sp. VKM F-103]OBT95523.1 hypothetical protein VE01_05162 [Pseudogymnoascus verrucosus]
MPPKRPNEGSDGQATKRAKPGQASDPAPKTASVPQRKATRSTKINGDGGTQISRSNPPPELQLIQIPRPTKPNGFPCFSDGDVLVILDHGDLKHQFRLHSQVLRNFSPVFGELLSAKLPEKIPKRILNANKTELEFCLELIKDPESGWCLQRRSLYRNATLDNSKAVPATGSQVKDYDGGFGSDGSSDDTLTLPTDRWSPPPPLQAPGVYSHGENPPRGSDRDTSPSPIITPKRLTLAEHLGSSPTQDLDVDMSSALGASGDSAQIDCSGCPQAQEDDEISVFERAVYNGTGEASRESCGSTIAKDNQTQRSTYPDTKVVNSVTGATILSNGAPPTPTYEPETSVVEMRQFARPEQISGDISADMEILPKEDACDSITSPRTEALDNEPPSAPTSDWESSSAAATAPNEEKKLDGSEMGASMNTPNIMTIRQGVVERFIPILNFHRANSAIWTGDKGEKAYSVGVNIEYVSVKGVQDDDCQLVSVHRKSQSAGVSPVIPIFKSCLMQQRKIHAYASLLRVAYYKPPIVSQKDISQALIQSEHLIEAAKLYQTLPAIEAHVSHLLAQHGRSLFQSVALDPVRWLNISINLKNKIIFQEAMIHLVGRIPDEFTSETFSGVPHNILRLLQRKYREMDEEISRVSRLLSAGSIYEFGIRADLTDKSSFDIWVLAGLWREWFATNFEKAKTEGRHPEEPTIQSKLGLLYRTIYAGGDAYLPKQKVLDILRPFQKDGADQTGGFLQWDTAEFDLTLMKAYARKVVQNLCYNRSRLDPSEAGFSYLTCTHIDDIEFPWVNAPRN